MDLESVARALVPPGKGILAAGQQAFYHRARCNGAARDGRYTPDLERAIA